MIRNIYYYRADHLSEKADHLSENDWSKLGLTDEIIDAVITKYVEQIETKYGGYENVSYELKKEILEFLRKKS